MNTVVSRASRSQSRFRDRLFLLALLVLLSLSFFAFPAFAQGTYQKPPKEILDVLNAPLPPSLFLSPKRDLMLLASPVIFPTISDMAEPMLRLAGVRFNPRNNAERGYIYYFISLTLKRLSDGKETPIALPPGVGHIDYPRWNADGTMFAFANETPDKIELWVVDVASLKPRLVPNLHLNPVLSDELQWMADQRTLLVKAIPADRGAAPEAPAVPPGPKIQENLAGGAPSSTYEVRDVLKSPHDEDLFDYYAQSQIALVDTASLRVSLIGKPAIFAQVSPSPDGRCLLLERIHRPYSYLFANYRFPREVEVWNTAGEFVEKIASLPLADRVPIQGVPTGPRDFEWRPTEPATLVWTEALDGGNPKTKVPHRDRIMIKRVGAAAAELVQTEERYGGLRWLERGGLVLISDYDPDRHWIRTFVLNADAHPAGLRPLWSLSEDEKYHHPGYPVFHTLANGAWAVIEEGGWIYLDGAGSSPEGDRPFLDRLNMRTLKSERLFRCDRDSYEYFAAWVNPVAGTFITRRETPADPPNYFLRTLGKMVKPTAVGEPSWTSSSRPVTNFRNPTPQLAGIQKRLVTYKRADGVPLTFMLYLPPGYKAGTRLPTVVWAYPLDYTEQSVAGQVEGSSKRFTTIRGDSELFFLLEGYAVLDDAAMPVVGPAETVYDTFVEQITANAKAAIDKAVELGVTDPDRVGVGGHSHGALMTANLLTWTELFRTGVARSGAYNHTLRPFGFQNEHRTLYQARDTYIKLSPVLNADKIKVPILLIHGELDANPGTVPLQSEKYYEALRGLGKTVRYVVLPYESHGYQAKESIEQVLYEMITWFDKYVKNAQARGGQGSGATETVKK